MISMEINELLQKNKIKYFVLKHELSGKTTDDAEKALGISKKWIVKSLFLENYAGEYVGVIIPGDKRLNFSKFKKVLREEKKLVDYNFVFVKSHKVEKILGYKIGGIPPFVFFLKKIPAYVDISLLEKDFIIGSGGDDYTGIKFSPEELSKLNYRYVDIIR